MQSKTLRSDVITVVIAASIGIALLGLVLEPSADESPRAPQASLWPLLGPSDAASGAQPVAPVAPGDRVPPALELTAPATAVAPAAAGTPPPRERPLQRAPADALQKVHTTLQGSLPGSLRRALSGELGDAVSATYARLFMWDLDLRRALWPGDRIAAVFTVDAQGDVVIEGARLGSQKLRRDLDAYRFHASGDAFASYWSADGTEVAHRLVDSPIEGYEQVTSLLRDRPNHQGMDFMAPVGTAITAPVAGRVTRVNWNRAANGLCVELERADGALLKFLHLSEVQVAAGASVKKGQTIALSGNTGRSTGPHLHYQINKGARVLDPIEVHGTMRRQLPAKDRAAFAEAVARVDALLGVVR